MITIFIDIFHVVTPVKTKYRILIRNKFYSVLWAILIFITSALLIMLTLFTNTDYFFFKFTIFCLGFTSFNQNLPKICGIFLITSYKIVAFRHMCLTKIQLHSDSGIFTIVYRNAHLKSLMKWQKTNWESPVSVTY